MSQNWLLKTDSYKPTHWPQYPEGTENVYSYFESREGATFDFTLFAGLQSILIDYFEGVRVTQEQIDEADVILGFHFGTNDYFNREGWEHIVNAHGGKLPLRIRAVPEGAKVPTGNVLMTVEATDPKCYWLTNYVESILTHVWYPSTVATLSRSIKEMLIEYLDHTGSDPEAINFMLHDFGYRGATVDEAGAIGGMAHIINFMGTDTLVAMELAHKHYDADYASLAFSIPASEHSTATSLGREGEYDQLTRLLEAYPTGPVSSVGDSYNIYDFTHEVCRRKDEIMARDGRVVVRPDSTTDQHATPHGLVVWILHELWDTFGGEVNSKGYKVLDTHVRVIWGDGIDRHGIKAILDAAKFAGFAAENLVFGMGGGLLQKVNRDTQRFAFKCSAQKRYGEWHDVSKDPVGGHKKSKAGRLELRYNAGAEKVYTARWDDPMHELDSEILVTVFENGEIKKRYTFDEIRERSNA